MIIIPKTGQCTLLIHAIWHNTRIFVAMRPWYRLFRTKLLRGYHNGVHLLRTRMSKVQYIMITATLTGFVSGIMAVLLKRSVQQVERLVQHFSGKEYLFLLCPAVGLQIGRAHV